MMFGGETGFDVNLSCYKSLSNCISIACSLHPIWHSVLEIFAMCLVENLDFHLEKEF